jgi:hypothetical protein
MSKHSESTAERLERMKREREAAQGTRNEGIVSQLTHESTGEPNFADIAGKLQARKESEEKPSVMENTVKFTIYVDADVAAAFKALCIERGDQRRYATQAFADFVAKKVKELGL